MPLLKHIQGCVNVIVILKRYRATMVRHRFWLNVRDSATNIYEDAFCLIFTCTSFHQISSTIHRIFTSKELEDHWIIGHNGQQESSISN